jgi:uncharacterized membrane protein
MFGVPLHKLIVHFPIALTFAALVCDWWAVYSKRPELHNTSYGMSLWAAVMALAAVITGLQHASAVGLVRVATGHAGLGIGASVLLVALAFLRYSVRARDEVNAMAYPMGWLVLLTLAAGLIFATAITGHTLFG